MEPILEMQHITYSYHTTEGETKALEDVSFSVSEGEFIAIVGPSGCGKSTLLNILGLLDNTSIYYLWNLKARKRGYQNEWKKSQTKYNKYRLYVTA
mgnify:CR=1 FL=1